MTAIIRHILVSLGLLLSLLTFASRLGRFSWLFDLLSHYHVQYTVGIAVCLVGLLLLRWLRRYLLILGAALLLNLVLVVPFLFPSVGRSAQALPNLAAHPAPLRVMAMNISTSNAGYGKVVDLIRQRQPDVVFLSEVRSDLVALLQQELADRYPYLHAEPSRITLGIALLSRRPYQKMETVILPGEGRMARRYLRAEIVWQGQPVTLVGIHPLPPMNGSWAASRDRELQQMAKEASAATQPFVLLGDLNASPWSHPMQQLLARSDLRYAAKGYGMGLTWRLAGVLLGAPLDHILISPQWTVLSYSEEGDIGSDHLPIQADLRLVD
jgi:endonuclease/exonuclease/phosphatase (EEP) superfamily protein YafD